MKIAFGFGPGLSGAFGRGGRQTRGLEDLFRGLAPRNAQSDLLRGLQAMKPHQNQPSATTPDRPGERTLLDFRAVHAEEQTAAALQVMTDEGDMVTITGREEVEVTYGRLRTTRFSPEGTSRSDLRFFNLSAEQEFSVTVEGHLNEREQRDIETLIERLGPRLKNLGRGGGSRFLPVNSAGLESLAGFKLDVFRSCELTKIHISRFLDRPDRPEPEKLNVPLPLDQAPEEPEVNRDDPVQVFVHDGVTR